MILSKKKIAKIQVRAWRRHRINPEWFYSLTPNQYYLYEEDYKLEREDEEKRFARICAVLAELQRDTKKRTKPYTEADFMPAEFAKKETKKDFVSNFRKFASALKFKRIK